MAKEKQEQKKQPSEKRAVKSASLKNVRAAGGDYVAAAMGAHYIGRREDSV